MALKLRIATAVATAALAAAALPASAVAQSAGISVAEGLHAGELAVPVNKSQVLRSDRPYAKALIGNPEIADVLPLTNQSLYVLGKKSGTTSLTLYDRGNMLIAVVDVVVGPDVTSVKRQLSELMPSSDVGARISNDSIVLEGIVPNGPAADRAVQIAETYAPGKVVNLLSIGSSQQVMLEVRFSEVKRSTLKQLGAGFFVGSDGGKFGGAIGGNASLTPGPNGTGELGLGAIGESFGILTRTFRAFGANFEAAFDALERKGAITTLAEPTLVALSGETASFLAGGEFPVPVAQSAGGGGGTGAGGGVSNAITVQWKPFGVSLAFTPTVLADGVINLLVEPEVSSIDATASIVINNLTIPGLQTRRAKTMVELRDGETFMMAGLIRRDFSDTVRQFPVLGSLPIIGSLFRSTGFNREETELVILVTPRLVRSLPAGTLKSPTDRVKAPNEADLFLLGRTDTGVPSSPLETAPVAPPPPPPPPPAPYGGGGAGMAAVGGAGGNSTAGGAAVSAGAAGGPTGFEKEYGHVF